MTIRQQLEATTRYHYRPTPLTHKRFSITLSQLIAIYPLVTIPPEAYPEYGYSAQSVRCERSTAQNFRIETWPISG